MEVAKLFSMCIYFESEYNREEEEEKEKLLMGPTFIFIQIKFVKKGAII